ncbi:MAG TPA: HAMP domain-containing sensor histidine kinase [Oligoflexus sp.]|uniref:sensor histidine kinase n=1 Tax=Oligoflexus sp. TaxID=1971216 RepID=UPI002D383786|nr:HAMP domain-containing sensor histidine kinase [Oligoflexus sp.]HYX37400.1 HAMP domain-containing sensor histidine kinase [Oligoflexus sp.]
MPRQAGEGDYSLFDRSVWTEPLFKFAQVSRLVISLYDRHGKRWCGPCFNHALAARLASAGIWEVSGWGSQHERALVQRCVTQNETVHEVIADIFGHLAVPCKHEGQVMLVQVLGWVHQRVPDSAALENLVDQLHVPSPELGQLLRVMPPIPEENLRAHGQMLETFSSTLLQQVLIHKQTHRQAAGLKILNDTAFAFAGATTEQEICQIAHMALKGLLRHAQVEIKLNPPEEVARGVALMTPALSSRRPISLPIFGASNFLFGQIEISPEYGTPIEFFMEPLSALAKQLGVALQKSRWLRSLETERHVLEVANTELKRLHQVKDEFLATVSQELKTPLNAIMGWARILGDQEEKHVKEALLKIEGSARHQSRLIEDLLDISRITSGKMSLQKEEIEAAALITTTLDSVMPLVQARGQTLELRLTDQPIRLRGDRMRLQQVFWNLLSNASKFTPDGGQITVILEDMAPYVRFEVMDSGQGIAAADVIRLFDSFHLGEACSAREPGGLGLGLTLVKHLVELHGGSVAVKSAGKGQGATFSVLLPQAFIESQEPGYSDSERSEAL